ncbi:MAG: glycosyltransferase family 4 protein [bacterium]|nr:glycosyltransferase family 4 protein [bacterium]
MVFKENELVAMVNQLVFEQGQMKRIGDNARTVIEQHYSKKKNEERIARVLGSFAIKSVR